MEHHLRGVIGGLRQSAAVFSRNSPGQYHRDERETAYQNRFHVVPFILALKPSPI
jgi:hypothetical protein